MHQLAPCVLVAGFFRAGGLWALEGRGGNWIIPPGHSPDFSHGPRVAEGADFALAGVGSRHAVGSRTAVG